MQLLRKKSEALKPREIIETIISMAVVFGMFSVGSSLHSWPIGVLFGVLAGGLYGVVSTVWLRWWSKHQN